MQKKTALNIVKVKQFIRRESEREGERERERERERLKPWHPEAGLALTGHTALLSCCTETISEDANVRRDPSVTKIK
jgi:hypothetical protein